MTDQYTIYTLGHGGGVPTGDAKGNTNYAIVEGHHGYDPDHEVLKHNRFWLVDCGPATVEMLCKGPMPSPTLQNLQGVFITHCHADHSGGLPSLAWRLKFVEQRKVQLVYPMGLYSMLSNQMTELTYDTTGWIAWESFWDTGFNTADFLKKFFPVDHNIKDFPNFGLLIILGGQRVIFSGDTAKPLESHLLDFADVVYHDHQSYNADKATAVHCHYSWLLEDTTLEQRAKVLLAHAEAPATYLEDGFGGWAHKGHFKQVGALSS